MEPRHDRPSAGPILVVDDEPAVRGVIRDLLEDEGYVTLAAANGREAIRVLDDGPVPCAIVLDLMMPEMDGWEFAAWLRCQPRLRTTPYVVLTARRQAPEAGLDDAVAVLAKPIEVRELLAAIGPHCAGAGAAG